MLHIFAMANLQAVPSSLRGALDAALGADAKALDAGDWQRALKKVWASKWTATWMTWMG